MAVDDELRMDHEQVRAVALEVSDLAVALESVKRYAEGDGLKAEHLGGHESAPGAFNAFNDAVHRLSASVGKAHDFLIEASRKLTESAKMTQETDVENAWGITKAGGGK
jgi:hypothetical protein